jgi:hypothetical protein
MCKAIVKGLPFLPANPKKYNQNFTSALNGSWSGTAIRILFLFSL